MQSRPYRVISPYADSSLIDTNDPNAWQYDDVSDSSESTTGDTSHIPKTTKKKVHKGVQDPSEPIVYRLNPDPSQNAPRLQLTAPPQAPSNLANNPYAYAPNSDRTAYVQLGQDWVPIHFDHDPTHDEIVQKAEELRNSST